MPDSITCTIEEDIIEDAWGQVYEGGDSEEEGEERPQ